MHILRPAFAVFFALVIASAAKAANATDSLQRRLPSLKGSERLEAMEQLCHLNQDTEDVESQLHFIRMFANEARHQDNAPMEAVALSMKAVLFYNNDMNDSVLTTVREDMKRVRELKAWRHYYEMWAEVANTLIFTGQNHLALHETQAMYNDAEQFDDKQGMGLAYSIMGMAYANLHNYEQSDEAYRKSIDWLSQVRTPMPPTLLDVYAYYGDVLDETEQYQRLKALTHEWRKVKDFIINQHALKGTATADLYNYYYFRGCAQAALGLHDTQEAARSLEQMSRLMPSEDSPRGRSWLYYMAILAIEQGDYARALEYNDRRTNYLYPGGDPAVAVNVKRQRAEIMTLLERYQEAADLYRTVYQANDSLNAQETKSQLTELNTIFGVADLEQQKERLKMEKQKAQLWWAIAVSVLVAVSLAVFIFFRLRAARRLEAAHGKLQTAYADLQAANAVIEETTAAKERIESELRIARDIQMSMVPATFPERDDLDLYASMTPAKEVGGDLYSYLLEGDKLYFCVGDVSGKGVPASLFMAQTTRLFHTLAKQMMPPAELATRLNDELAADNEQGMFVTMFIGLADLNTGHLSYCNCGHNPPIITPQPTTPHSSLLTPNPSLPSPHFIDMTPNAPIGLWPEMDFEGQEIDSIANTPLFIYTDGLNEAENIRQEQFGDQQLLDVLQQHPFAGSKQTVEMMQQQVARHADGAEPSDDLTLMSVLIRPQAAAAVAPADGENLPNKAHEETNNNH